MGPILCDVLAKHGAEVIASHVLLSGPYAAERLIASSGDVSTKVRIPFAAHEPER